MAKLHELRPDRLSELSTAPLEYSPCSGLSLEAEHLGDRILGELLHIAEMDDLLLEGREHRRSSFPDQVLALCPLERRHDRRYVRVRVEDPVGRQRLAVLAGSIATVVPSDREHPGTKARLTSKGTNVIKGRGQRILCELFGLLVVGHIPSTQSLHIRLQAGEDLADPMA